VHERACGAGESLERKPSQDLLDLVLPQTPLVFAGNEQGRDGDAGHGTPGEGHPANPRADWTRMQSVESGLSTWSQHDDPFPGVRPHDLPLVYHYTTVAATIQILERRQLWLCSAATMNDSTEGVWLEDRLMERETELSLQRGAPRSVAEAERWRALWLEAFRLGAPQAYLACFSAEGDMLSQWRAYAADGEGVAIGFDPNEGKMPVRPGSPTSHVNPTMSCTMSQVVYGTEAVLAELTELLDSAIQAEMETAESVELTTRLAAARWLTKNPAFTEEREWRIVNLPMQFDGDLGGGQTALSMIGTRRYRSPGARLISYFELPFDPQAVRELVLGPRSAIHDHELELLLRDSGLAHVTVRRSSATYRR
jgi:Protein of unknown function (DUF2971)